MTAASPPQVLRAPLVVEFPFTRSLGPVQSAFLTGLRERVVLGVRTAAGQVMVPPVEYDPVTAEEIRELVEVAPTGTVTTWAWNADPRPQQPLTTPFAWVLVRLDGADTAMLHALDAPGPDAVRTGMRVRIRWATDRTGAITDIACFEPADEPRAPPARHPPRRHLRRPRHRHRRRSPPGLHLQPRPRPDRLHQRPLRAADRRRALPLLPQGLRPPRGACPTCGVATTDRVEVGPAGTVTTYCIVNIKARGLDIEVPYVYAHIALDGADLALHGRIGGIPYDQVRMGLRVEPVWSDGGRYPDHYRPTGEPDADYDAYKELI